MDRVINVQFPELNDLSVTTNDMNSNAERIRERLNHLKNSLDWSIQCSSGIDTRLQNACRDIEGYSQLLIQMTNFLIQAVKDYQDCENEISGDGKSTPDIRPIAPNSTEDVGWFKQFVSEHKDGFEFWANLTGGLSAATSLVAALTFWCPPVAAALETTSLISGGASLALDASLAGTKEGSSDTKVLLDAAALLPGALLVGTRAGLMVFKNGETLAKVADELTEFRKLPKVLETPLNDWIEEWAAKGYGNFLAGQAVDYTGATITLVSMGQKEKYGVTEDAK